HGVIRLERTKTGESRTWALRADVARVLARLGDGRDLDEPVFDGLPAKMAALFRWHLRAAGVHRPELFERTPQRRPIRIHDQRATFCTLNLAAGKSEAWICDRTGHRSSQMVNAYRRAARTATELGLGELLPLDECVPELCPEAMGVPEGVPRGPGHRTVDGRNTSAFRVVRERGVEPPRLAAPEPKSGASANSATRAFWGPRLEGRRG